MRCALRQVRGSPVRGPGRVRCDEGERRAPLWPGPGARRPVRRGALPVTRHPKVPPSLSPSYGASGMDITVGPWRVYPGKLAVSRAFGDLRAKNPKYGGKKGVIVAEPDIKVLKISKHHDFILLASKSFFEGVSF